MTWATLTMACSITIGIAAIASADDTSDATVGTALQFANLTEPPTEFAELIAAGQVDFSHGPVDDPRRFENGRRMAAETSYRIHFDYDAQYRWRFRGRRITVVVGSITTRWQPVHQVWFRRPPDVETFWSDPLVRHELDHVQISTHRSLEQTLRTQIAAIKRIDGQILSGETTEAAASRLIDETVKRVFADVSDLVAIRYVELDRQTNHGLLPRP